MTYADARGYSRKLLLDYDDPGQAALLAARLPSIARQLRCRVRSVCIMRSSSGRGLHAVVELSRKLPPGLIVALQAVLGSDWLREVFNVVRVEGIPDAPPFFARRWNVLYERKRNW